MWEAFFVYKFHQWIALAARLDELEQQPGASHGVIFSSAGDVNGVGYSDFFLISTLQADNEQVDEGQVVVSYDCGTGARITPQQLRVDSATPIQLLVSTHGGT